MSDGYRNNSRRVRVLSKKIESLERQLKAEKKRRTELLKENLELKKLLKDQKGNEVVQASKGLERMGLEGMDLQ